MIIKFIIIITCPAALVSFSLITVNSAPTLCHLFYLRELQQFACIISSIIMDGVNATTIRIPQQGITPAGGSEVQASGWGATSENGNTTTILRAVTLPVHTLSECRQMLGITAITSRQFCAGPREGGKDTCQGDSGGPVVQNNTQVGIVSNGVGCARENSPGVYTNVGSFNRWIRLTTGGQVS
ncbi:hypothetical protein K1T71_005209 [Dendrolimus kikuchii]|uniref:Uncharacterized protein n=1 Tax=Dendrolimus kikuchii TaxID=765133 RepID=A0ACC1D7W2_9NEOP|nr:hypothetical protein K1T71_005209 [Dendrolimus kikuchii]